MLSNTKVSIRPLGLVLKKKLFLVNNSSVINCFHISFTAYWYFKLTEKIICFSNITKPGGHQVVSE